MVKRSAESPKTLQRLTPDRAKTAQNKLLPRQVRKQLGKHYANKYRAGRG
jgi:hypothetical protein